MFNIAEMTEAEKKILFFSSNPLDITILIFICCHSICRDDDDGDEEKTGLKITYVQI